MIKKFANYYKRHTKLFLLDFSSAFLISAMELITPFMISRIIDNVLPAGNMRLLTSICIGLLVLYLIKWGLEYIVDYYGHYLGVCIEYDMRKDLFDHIQKLSMTYFDNTRTGHLISRIVNDLNDISELAHHGPEDFFSVLVILTGSFIAMLFLNARLALIVFLVVPVMLAYAITKNKKMRRAFDMMRKKIADVNAQVEDSVSGIKVVKSFTNEAYEANKFDEGNTAFKDSKKVAYRAMAEFYPAIQFMSGIIQLLVVFFGGWFIYRGTMSYGDIVGFLLYVNMFMQPIRKATNLLEQYQKGISGFRRFDELMMTNPDIVDSPHAITLEKIKGKIQFEQVEFSYEDGKKVLEHLDLTVLPGQTVALVGPSGVGKTTVCSLIPRFYEADSGAVKVDDVDIRDITQVSLRDHIGIVQQDVFLFSGTVKENIAYGDLNATMEEIVKAAKLANAHDFIMGLENGYDSYVGERGLKLSGGQKQRIAIARVFLKNPPILILDEATSALDNESERLVQASLSKLSAGRTTLVIAHRLTTVMHADQILVMTDKGIEEKGTHKELMQIPGGIYRRLVEIGMEEEEKEGKNVLLDIESIERQSIL